MISNVFNCDCMEYMRLLPDKHFDLAICDPPYFSGPEKRTFYGTKISRTGVHRTYHKSSKWIVPSKEYFAELERICKFYVVFGCNYYDWIPSGHGRIVWDKCNGKSSFSDCEIAATNLFSSVRLFRYMWNGMMQGKSIAEGHIMQGNKRLNEKRIHPTQKPVALYMWILQNYAKEGWHIFDSHLGSGSSRIAAYNLGYDFTACELDPYYFNAQQKRFNDLTHELDIFTINK